MHVERTFTVTHPVESVFEYLSDFENTNEWDPGTVSTRRSSGDGGLGTTYANTSEFMGRTTELTYETTAYEPPGRFQATGRNKTATATDTMTFTSLGEGTRIHYRADFDFGKVLNLVGPLLLQRKLEKLADETVTEITRSLSNRT